MLNSLVIGEAQSTTLGTALFVTLSMLILIGCIKKFAWGPITDILRKREEKIANDLDSAETSRTEAAKLAAKRQAELQNSKSEALDIIKEAKSTAETNKQTAIAEATAQTAKLKERAKADIELEKEQTLASVKDEVADLSLQIAEKILKKELSQESHQALIDSYIEGLGK